MLWQASSPVILRYKAVTLTGDEAVYLRGRSHAGHLDVDVDAVQEGAGDAPDPLRVRLVAADQSEGAGAFIYLVTTRKTTSS